MLLVFSQQLQVGFQVSFPELPVLIYCWNTAGMVGLLEPSFICMQDLWSPARVMTLFRPDCSAWSEDQLSDMFRLFQITSISERWRPVCSYEPSARKECFCSLPRALGLGTSGLSAAEAFLVLRVLVFALIYRSIEYQSGSHPKSCPIS